MNPRAKKFISLAVRLAVVAGAVLWLVRDPQWNWTQLWNVVRHADRRLMLLGLLAFGPAPILIALRLKLLLSVHEIHLSTWETIKLVFGANFLISALPVGTSGGDAAKALYVASRTPHKHEAVTTVFFDRVIGVVSLVLLSGTMVLLNWRNPAMAQWGKMIGVLCLVFFGGGAMYFSGPLRKLLRLEQIVSKLPLGHHVNRIDRAVLEFRQHMGKVLLSLLLTIMLQAVAIVSLYLVGWGLGLVGDRPAAAFPIYFAYTPICLLMGALPLGVMEVTYKELFSGAARFGSPEAAVTLAILGRMIQLVWALPGALVVLGGAYRYTPEQIHEAELELDATAPEPAQAT